MRYFKTYYSFINEGVSIDIPVSNFESFKKYCILNSGLNEYDFIDFFGNEKIKFSNKIDAVINFISFKFSKYVKTTDSYFNDYTTFLNTVINYIKKGDFNLVDFNLIKFTKNIEAVYYSIFNKIKEKRVFSVITDIRDKSKLYYNSSLGNKYEINTLITDLLRIENGGIYNPEDKDELINFRDSYISELIENDAKYYDLNINSYKQLNNKMIKSFLRKSKGFSDINDIIISLKQLISFNVNQKITKTFVTKNISALDEIIDETNDTMLIKVNDNKLLNVLSNLVLWCTNLKSMFNKVYIRRDGFILFDFVKKDEYNIVSFVFENGKLIMLTLKNNTEFGDDDALYEANKLYPNQYKLMKTYIENKNKNKNKNN